MDVDTAECRDSTVCRFFVKSEKITNFALLLRRLFLSVCNNEKFDINIWHFNAA